MEAVYRDYAPKGVKFYYLYKALAHPGLNGYVAPLTLEERLMHVEEAKRTLGSDIPWLCDNMDDSLRKALGEAPNSEFVIDPEGKILAMRVWSEPDDLRRDLEEHVGPVEKPTEVSELEMKTAPPPELAPTGVVPLLKRQQNRYRALLVEPHLEQSKFPFYVKLRAEADRELLEGGAGKLYLGFFPDPIHHVHWNNQVAPVRYAITAPEGVDVSPASAQGPKVEEPADSDPREFLLDVKLDDARAPVTLDFHYYACSEKWCMPVSQRYTLRWEADPAGGRAMTGRKLRPGEGPQDPISRMMERDIDGDGAIQRDEAPENFGSRFDRMDANGDGSLTREEMEAMRGRMQGPNLRNLDRNGDGKVTKDELPPPMQQRFERMDANGNGTLEESEMPRRRPAP
ncbi:MAG: hypothetical protein H6509_03385 [Bryobacterales bacterium]|nr:hypothetical protein [Bryobacterales bacterium]